MRPGAAGFVKIAIVTALMGLVAVGLIVGIEAGTMRAGDPISWFMSEADRFVVFLASLIAGFSLGLGLGVVLALACHFWWPARASWPLLWRAVGEFGDPDERKGDLAFYTHARHLWRLYRGAK
jgi:hypothetical protein